MEVVRYKGFYYHHTIDETPSPDGFSRHCHNMFEMIYIRRGRGNFIVEGTKYAIHPGCLLVFRPREFHYINVNMDTTYDRFVVHFTEDAVFASGERLLAPFFMRKLGSHNICYDVSEEEISPLLRLAKCKTLDEPDRELMSRLLLNELLINMRQKFTASDESDPREELINRIIGYINNNLDKPIRMDALAEQFYISKYHLSHLFKESTGLPVMEYLIRKRVLTAQQMIASGSTAADAAAANGFNDYSSFYRMYVKYIGEKPSEAESR